MKISEIPLGESTYTALSSTVLCVLSRREDGWCIYIGSVPGRSHREEASDVLLHGTKLKEHAAIAIAASYWHPGFDAEGCPYAE